MTKQQKWNRKDSARPELRASENEPVQGKARTTQADHRQEELPSLRELERESDAHNQTV